MRVRIKICGVTTPDAATAAADLGVDALGFVFAESPRRVTVNAALDIAAHVPALVTRVAVFRHPSPTALMDVVRAFRPDVVQTEPSAEILAALGDTTRVLPVFHDEGDLPARVGAHVDRSGSGSVVLVEAAGRGGRGIAPDWTRAAGVARTTRLVLAGGLTPDNVGQAILAVRPFGVDVSSGIESSPGVKDPALIAEFVDAVREAEHRAVAASETAP